jgi:hypothetical protein
MIDWIHHGVMVVVMLPLAYCLVPGHLLGHGAFYASGLPGGIDYLMLVLVKKGWMDSITEKKWNEPIQVLSLVPTLFPDHSFGSVLLGAFFMLASHG